MPQRQQQATGKLIFVQGSPGYEKVLSMGTAFIATKVTKALQATAASSVHSKKEELNDLSSDQVLLLSLVHSMIMKDKAACYIFTGLSTKVDSIKSPHLKDWLEEEYIFTYDEVRKALSFAAELTKEGLEFPEFILTILEELYFIYCVPAKRFSYNESIPVKDLNKFQFPSVNGILKEKEKTPPRSDNTLPRDATPSKKVAQKPRKLDDPSHLVHTPVILPSRVLGEYSQCEQFALQRENQESPKYVDSASSPCFKDFRTPPCYEQLKLETNKFIFKESDSCNSLLKQVSTEAISDIGTEADAINERTGDTALHLAVSRENLEAVITFINKGANVKVVNKAGVTPLQMAVERENLPIIKALYHAGADINQKNSRGESLLHIAATVAGLETIELLIELGAQLDSLDSRKQTPLFRAAKKGYVVVLEKLEESGADIHLIDTFGRSLLHYAAWHGQVEAVQWLINNGLRLDAKSKHDWTPLHWAVANGHLKVAHVLLMRGSDVNARDSNNKTPLSWAADVGNLALVDLLKSYNGEI